MSTAAQSVRYPFPASSAQPAGEKTVLDQDLERALYMEAVCYLQDSDFDHAVVAVYQYRPERELPNPSDSRRTGIKYLFPE